MVSGGDGRLREGGGWMKWSDKIQRITKSSISRLGDGWIRSTCLEEFLCKIMRLVKVLVKERNDYGWMKLGSGWML